MQAIANNSKPANIAIEDSKLLLKIINTILTFVET